MVDERMNALTSAGRETLNLRLSQQDRELDRVRYELGTWQFKCKVLEFESEAQARKMNQQIFCLQNQLETANRELEMLKRKLVEKGEASRQRIGVGRSDLELNPKIESSAEPASRSRSHNSDEAGGGPHSQTPREDNDSGEPTMPDIDYDHDFELLESEIMNTPMDSTSLSPGTAQAISQPPEISTEFIEWCSSNLR